MEIGRRLLVVKQDDDETTLREVDIDRVYWPRYERGGETIIFQIENKHIFSRSLEISYYRKTG